MTRAAVVLSEILLVDVVNRLFESRDKGLRLSQGVLRQLEFRDQHTVFIDNDQRSEERRVGKECRL